MNKFVLQPNLPETPLKLALAGEHGEINRCIEKLGIELITLKDNEKIDFSIRNHADAAACNVGGGRIFLEEGQTEAAERLRSIGMHVFEAKVSGEYPGDVRLNCALFGMNYIYSAGTDERITQAVSQFARCLKVRQGYCRCSVCIVSDNAIITDDVGIYKAAKHFMDVLYIRKGDILLEGKEYGFIGGATAKIDRNTLLFFGNPETHRDFQSIRDFLSRHNVRYISLFQSKLTDIGGLVGIL